MHDIEPFYHWDSHYSAESDPFSPFYQVEHSELYFTNTVYNYYIHPQWENFGSSTLYLKILYADYTDSNAAIIELIGEWNDALHNDIMYLKREIVDHFSSRGINHFILIGENVLNFHSSDDEYYQEWMEDVEDGWIVFLNFREHVIREMKLSRIHHCVELVEEEFNWRKYQPLELIHQINSFINRRIN
ncbi:MAG: hypothetical protein K1X82_03335 [Bacteroidia bacterium]|nr:hypothetical protein [Bacteroidia bacterium]